MLYSIPFKFSALLYFSNMAWKDYFNFNKRQRNGVIVLLGLILLAMVCLIITDFMPPSSANIDFSSFRNDMKKIKFKQVDTTTSTTAKNEVTENKPPLAPNTVIEINSADSADLMKLPLITPKVARTMVRGYYNKSQLLEVYGMDTACYNSMIKYIKVDVTRVEKLDINKATEKAMTHHPYIHKKLAKAIFDYRKQNGGFKDIKEIMKVEGVDKELYSKLSPYLSITE